MKTIAITIIIIFGAFSALGVAGFGMAGHGAGHPCPFASLQGGDCPQSSNAALFAMHHLSGMRGVMRTIVTLGISITGVLLAVVFRGLSPSLATQVRRRYFHILENVERAVSADSQPISIWLAMRNKRDIPVPYRALGYIS